MLPMAYIIFFVLISMPLVFGERLLGSKGAVYDYNFKHENYLGKGAEGEVFLGQKTYERNRDYKKTVAMKTFSSNFSDKARSENKIYNILGEHPGIPRHHDFLSTNRGSILIIELLGPDLFSLELDKMGRTSFERAMMIGIKLLDILEYVHEQGLIYHDLKPENIAVGQDFFEIYIFDFGFTRPYKNANGVHIVEGRPSRVPAAGTDIYLSLYGHNHLILSRRDDLESLAYMLIHLIEGLIWGRIPQGPEAWRHIFNLKNKHPKEITSIEILAQFLFYVRSLRFDGRPDYDLLRGLLLKGFGWDRSRFPSRRWTP